MDHLARLLGRILTEREADPSPGKCRVPRRAYRSSYGCCVVDCIAATSRTGARRTIFAQLSLVYGIGACIVVAGLAFTVWARIHLGRNWSGTVTLKYGHELVRSGPYRIVRHPIYTGLLVAFAGSAIARGEWRGIVAVFIAFAALWRKLRLEERWMVETFGNEYLEYRAGVAALILFVY